LESPNSSKPQFQETGSWISLRSLQREWDSEAKSHLFVNANSGQKQFKHFSDYFCVCVFQIKQNYGLGHHEGKSMCTVNDDRIFMFEFLSVSNEVTQESDARKAIFCFNKWLED